MVKGIKIQMKPQEKSYSIAIKSRHAAVIKEVFLNNIGCMFLGQ